MKIYSSLGAITIGGLALLDFSGDNKPREHQPDVRVQEVSNHQ